MLFSTVPKVTKVVLTNEKVTGPPAREMIMLCGIDTQSIVLDNATGGGVAALASNAKYAVDINNDMLELAKSRGLQTLQADQASIPLDSRSFSHIINSFGVFFSIKDEKVLQETLRLLEPDGIAGFTSWKFIGWWPEIVTELPLPLPGPLDIFPSKWNDPDVVRGKLLQAGFATVQVTEYSFQPKVEIESFAKAVMVLINTVAKRSLVR